MTKWLVTGASGFVGRAVLARLAADPSNSVCAAVRTRSAQLAASVPNTVLSDLGPDTDWSAPLLGVDVVVHLAARVHVMHEKSVDALAEFRRINVQGTLNLARQAAQAGARRFVFVSSIKVNGGATAPGARFGPDDTPNPEDAYGLSKLEAETGLWALRAGAMEVVVLRPPLVYGPGVQANFRLLMQTLARGWPLPLGAINNQRSFVAVDNLVDLILVCAAHPAAANQTFLVSDGHDLSTDELLRRLARAMGRRARLWPIPVSLLQWCARLVGRGGVAQRLTGNLQLDISKARDLLGWVPPVDVDEGLRRAANDYLQGRN